MPTTNEWRWSWISDITDTKRVSSCVTPLNINVIGFKQATGGPLNSKELNDFAKSVQSSISSINSYLATYVQPVMNSLPAGGHGDKRFSRDASGYKIDSMSYGLQGATLFVFNDADSIKADGRYWVPAAGAVSGRPKTIAEAFEDVYKTIAANLTTTTTSTEVLYPDPWTAITELDVRLTAVEDAQGDLDSDCWASCGFSRTPGAVSPSMAAYVYHLIQVHNVSDWLTGDPDNITHSHLAVAAHNQAWSTINGLTSKSTYNTNRTWTSSLLNVEIERIRDEIRRTRGSSHWYSDASYPSGVTGVPSLDNHVNKIGTGTASDTNPHGIGYADVTNLGGYLEALKTFTGQADHSDSTPAYTSVLHVSNGDSLQTAIGKLDAAISVNYWTASASAIWITDPAQTLYLTKATSSSVNLYLRNTLSVSGNRLWINFQNNSSATIAQVGAGYYAHHSTSNKAVMIETDNREVAAFMKAYTHIGNAAASNYTLNLISATTTSIYFGPDSSTESSGIQGVYSTNSLRILTNNGSSLMEVVNFKNDQTTDFHGNILMHGTRILTNQQAVINEPSGGGTVDTEARAAINTIITRLIAHGLVADGEE